MTSLAATVLGLLADDDRLRVVAALALDASDPAEIAARTGLDVRRAGRALARLTSPGLVEQDGRGYRLVRERFRQALQSAPSEDAAPVLGSGLGPDADRVLATLLRNGTSPRSPCTARSGSSSSTTSRAVSRSAWFPEKDVNETLRESTPMSPPCAVTSWTKAFSAVATGSTGAPAARFRYRSAGCALEPVNR